MNLNFFGENRIKKLAYPGLFFAILTFGIFSFILIYRTVCTKSIYYDIGFLCGLISIFLTILEQYYLERCSKQTFFIVMFLILLTIILRFKLILIR